MGRLGLIPTADAAQSTAAMSSKQRAIKFDDFGPRQWWRPINRF